MVSAVSWSLVRTDPDGASPTPRCNCVWHAEFRAQAQPSPRDVKNRALHGDYGRPDGFALKARASFQPYSKEANY